MRKMEIAREPGAKALKKLKKLVRWRRLRPLTRLTGAIHAREIFYQSILYRCAQAQGIDLPALYPLGAAANYGLLYGLFRAISDAGCRNVLELGAGQTSLLLDAMSREIPDLKIASVETNKEWRDRISRKVAHQVIYSDLCSKPLFDVEAQCYRDLGALEGRKFDLVVVDGPTGSKRHSRWTSLEILTKHLCDEFIVIFDDAERDGEQDTIKRFMTLARGDVGYSTILAAKCQFIAFSPKYRIAKYF
jgi:16S rRNA G966 N2-methylase RsmD